AAGECLDLGFVPTPSLLRFLRDDEASAAELGKVGGMALVPGDEEGAHIGDGGVSSENSGDGVGEGALAVGSGAVGKHEDVLVGDAGAAIPDIAVQEALKFEVVVGDARKKRGPLRMWRPSRCCATGGFLSDVVERVGRSTDAGA